MKVRLIVSAVLLPLLLIVVLFLPTVVTTIVVAIAAALAAYELLFATGIVKSLRLVIYTMVVAFMQVLMGHFSMEYAVVVLGILVFAALLFSELLISHGKLPFSQISACFFAGIIVPLLFSSLVRIHALGYGRFYILLPFLLAFTADSGAYFAGCFLGKHKLAPNISPNKTIEGMVGGIAGAILGLMIYCLVLDLGFGFTANYLYALSYGIIGSLAAVFGDLIFSAIKRQTGIKDYGNLIPGHGGILDRFDSLMIVAPLTEVLLTFLPVVIK